MTIGERCATLGGVLQRRESSEKVVHYISPLLEGLAVPHAFSTRLGGVSTSPFDALNLGNPSACDVADTSEQITENYRRLQRAIGCEGHRRRWVHQVHGAGVELVRRGAPFEDGRQADALVCDDSDQIVAVRVADCVPVLLADEHGRVVAAVHAGWRGVIAGVVPAAVKAMHEIGATGRMAAAIGPCIGYDAFEVGPEVIDAFERAFAARAPVRRTPQGKGHVDLRAAIRLQLLHAGLHDDRIDTTDRCTFAHADEFFSHRREHGRTGRLAAMIAPSAGSKTWGTPV